MQGVQGYLTNGRTKVAAYEEYSILGRCPECRADLVNAGEEGGSWPAPTAGLWSGRADERQGRRVSAPSVSKNGPLGSYFLDTRRRRPVPERTRLRPGEAEPEYHRAGRAAAGLHGDDDRIASNLELPKSVAQSANLVARRLLPCRKDIGATIPAISAYSLLHACRSAGISHISHKDHRGGLQRRGPTGSAGRS